MVVLLANAFHLWAQEKPEDVVMPYKKRVLESVEIDLLMSHYSQDGTHSSVSGGIGSEELTNITPTIVVSIPLNDDDVLTIDAGLSAYTSASSSNINPFNSSGASRGGDDDDDDDDDGYRRQSGTNPMPEGSPWIASSGASRSDVLTAVSASYTHSSDDRNTIWNSNLSFSVEYDYQSIGFGGGLTKLFNDKNTELGFKAKAYLDKWSPIYPTELHEYSHYGDNFQDMGFFKGVTVWGQSGNQSSSYLPVDFEPLSEVRRNSYSTSISFSQILTPKLQAAVFLDLVLQEGLLSTPYHRIYFADKSNFYVGEPAYIPKYTSNTNTGVYQLADDIERLPGIRYKLPVGTRVNYYLNERLALRAYYRYYFDDWGVNSHNVSIELPVKVSPSFTLYPVYRFYTQGAVRFFSPFDTHLSTERYYTSDFDLSEFHSNQFGGEITYTDIFTRVKISKLGLKSVNLRYNHYIRSDGLTANIFSFGLKFSGG